MSSDRIIRSYLIISGLFTLAASLIWGINTLFLLDAGLSIFEVFVANAAFTAAMALFEIPTGVVAATRGRRASFLLSESTIAVGTLAYVGVTRAHVRPAAAGIRPGCRPGSRSWPGSRGGEHGLAGVHPGAFPGVARGRGRVQHLLVPWPAQRGAHRQLGRAVPGPGAVAGRRLHSRRHR